MCPILQKRTCTHPKWASICPNLQNRTNLARQTHESRRIHEPHCSGDHRHRHHHSTYRGMQSASVPLLACRLIHDGRMCRRGIRQGVRQLHLRRRLHHRQCRSAHRVWLDHWHDPVQVGRSRHHRRHHHGQNAVATPAVGNGTNRVHRRHSHVLRSRRSHSYSGGTLRSPPRQSSGCTAEYSGPRRSFHPARVRAAAPRPAHRNRRTERKPWHHPGTRPARSHPNRNHLRSDLQQTRSQVGTGRRSGKQG